ncbi:hypothetical protein M885DRAFT_517524 [Pelagophyceae sp. CCMP2097]|nr:hypothetical protein M885DRAFT_517524 [Pelagophyceae sp. CCMP2097]
MFGQPKRTRRRRGALPADGVHSPGRRQRRKSPRLHVHRHRRSQGLPQGDARAPKTRADDGCGAAQEVHPSDGA